jgi:hypothetical protein
LPSKTSQVLLSFDVADAKLQALADEPDGAHKPGEISASFDQKKHIWKIFQGLKTPGKGCMESFCSGRFLFSMVKSKLGNRHSAPANSDHTTHQEST